MTAPALLELDRVTRYFGALGAVNGVSLSVPPRERRAVIGPNGAGKTTLFNLITGHLAPSGGRILFEGRPITGLAPYRVAQHGIARSFQRTNLFARLTVLENLRLAAAAGGRGSWSLFGSITRLAAPLGRAREVAERVGLSDRLADQVARLSYGEQRQLEIGVALATDPRLLLLDEPTAGMSPEETFKTGELVKSFNAEGMTVLAVEHDMAFVRQIAQRVTVLHLGEVFARGSLETILEDEKVAEIYLGTTHAH
jgi:branched-chain amino acid transport system ATP-binding protein